MSYLSSKRRGLASKIVSVGLMVTTFAWLVGVPTAGAATTAETIAILMAQIQALTAQLTALQAASGKAHGCFHQNHQLAFRDDVTCLQQYNLNRPTYSGCDWLFWKQRFLWQSANGVSAIGIFGPVRAKYAAVGGTTTTTTTTTTTGTSNHPSGNWV